MFAGKAKSFEVGTSAVLNLAIISSDFLPTLSQAAGAKLDGIVGYNFLREFRVTIDYPQGRLLLEASPR